MVVKKTCFDQSENIFKKKTLKVNQMFLLCTYWSENKCKKSKPITKHKFVKIFFP
jgi:hypothetical protein